MTSIPERVAAGAAFLDANEPGWAERIDLRKLSIGSQCKCVLGQLHGSYVVALTAYGFCLDGPLDDDNDVKFGFMRDEHGGWDDEIDPLTAEWKRVITERRSA